MRIVTSSTADLGPGLPKQYGIDVVPLYVNLGGETFRDGIDITTQQLFSLVDDKGSLPKTAAPAPGDYLGVFDGAEEGVYVDISAAMSASFQAGRSVLPEGNWCAVDSRNLSTGIGLLVLKAAEMRDRGFSVAAIEQALLQAVPKVRTSFVIDTLRYLYMGGRCTALQSIAGSLLRIHPIIEVLPDGTLGIKAKVRGKREKAFELMLSGLEQDLAQLDRRRIFVTHTGCWDDAVYLKAEVERLASPDEVLITEAGSVVASHCGPDTIGILYMVQ